MQFRLRTLLILLAIGRPALAVIIQFALASKTTVVRGAIERQFAASAI